MENNLNRNEMEIKLESMMLVQKHYADVKAKEKEEKELAERNRKAREYINKVARKRKEEIKDNILFIVAPIVGVAFLYTCFQLTMALSLLLGGTL